MLLTAAQDHHLAGQQGLTRARGGGGGYLQPVHLTDSCIDEVVCVGWAAAEVEAQVPMQLGTGPWGLSPKEGGHRHAVHLQVQRPCSTQCQEHCIPLT